MSKEIPMLAAVDLGATNTRIAVWDMKGNLVDGTITRLPTDIAHYRTHIQQIGDTTEAIIKAAPGRGKLVAGAIVVAGAIENGVITQAGDLSPWIKNNIHEDAAKAWGLEEALTAAENDLVGVARDEVMWNQINDVWFPMAIGTFSSGYNMVYVEEDGTFTNGEAGHKLLYTEDDDMKCPCGGTGHAEAYVSGKGILRNHDLPAEDWLEDPENRHEQVQHVTQAIVNVVRNRQEEGHKDVELRWTGSVALRQPELMFSAAQNVQTLYKGKAPRMGTVSMGENAGTHGAFVIARDLALAA